MKLSPAQVSTFWRLWQRACVANAWTRDQGMPASAVEAKRKEVLAECGFDSLTKVDRTDGFTKVKNKLLILIGESIQAGKEDQDPTENRARTHRWVIEKEIIPCLALYIEDVTGYIAQILADHIRHYKTDRPTRPPTLGDLTPAQMKSVLMTLSARLNEKRASSGDTLHEMKTKAGLECDCAGCSRGRVILKHVVSSAVLVSNPF